jgi:LacI family transcriptional regulator
LVVEAANAVFLSRRYYLRLLKEQSADGMIYLAASLKDDFLKDMEKEPYPFVLLGNSSDGIDLPVVKSDDEKAASLAAQHLINLGHKKIAYVGGLAGYSMGLGRNRGFQNTMKEAGLEVQNTLLLDGNFSLEESERLVQTIVDQKATAILCASDSMAFGILRGLRNLGISVPSDMALVGMDDLEMSSWIEPSLTTVRTHIQEVAGAAAKYLIQKIQALPTQKLQFKEIPTPELIVRSSCGSKK